MESSHTNFEVFSLIIQFAMYFPNEKGIENENNSLRIHFCNNRCVSLRVVQREVVSAETQDLSSLYKSVLKKC